MLLHCFTTRLSLKWLEVAVKDSMTSIRTMHNNTSSPICHQHDQKVKSSWYGFVNMSLSIIIWKVCYLISLSLSCRKFKLDLFSKKECWKCSPVLSFWITGGLLTNWSVCAWPLLFLCQSQTQGSPTKAPLWRTGNRKSALHLAPCEYTAVLSRYPEDKHTAAQITNKTKSEDGQYWQYFQDHYMIMRVRFFGCKQMKWRAGIMIVT